MALKDSLRIRIAEDDLRSGQLVWEATLKSLNLPTMSASGTLTKSFNDDGTGGQTATKLSQGSLNLSEPLITGTNLSLSSTWTGSDSTISGDTLIAPPRQRTLPSVVANLTQPLFIFVGNDSLRTRRVAYLEWDNTQDGFRSQRIGIEVDARALFYNLLVQRETADVQKKKFESGQLLHNATRALVQAGKLAQVEISRADIRAQQDFRQFENAQIASDKALNQVLDFVSLPQGTRLTVTSQLSYEPFRVSLDRLIAIAIRKNPDLRSTERSIQLSEIQLRRDWEKDHLQLNALGSYARTLDRSKPDFPIDPYSWSAGLSLNWPFYDASQSRLRKQESELALTRAKQSYESQLRQLKVNIRNTYLELKRTENQISDFQPQRNSARENLRAVRLQYQHGLSRLTDVFDAENAVRDLELEYLGLLVSFNQARDQLKQQVGVDLYEQL